MEVNWELVVSGDRLKPDIPSPKGSIQRPFWTSIWLSERGIEGGNYEVKHLVDHYKDDEGNWRFLVTYKGYPESENTWEPPSSFVHGYTRGYTNYVRAHPDIPALFPDALTKPDCVIEKDGAHLAHGNCTPFFNRCTSILSLKKMVSLCHFEGTVFQAFQKMHFSTSLPFFFVFVFRGVEELFPC